MSSPTPKPSAAEPPLQSILVVDDEIDILESLREVFEANLEGVRVHTAQSGEEGLRILQERPVHLVISDYKMPGMDGLEFLSRARKAAPRSPRILITAYPELNVAVRAINEAQIQNFLTKPVSAETLLEVVSAALLKARRESPQAAAPPEKARLPFKAA